MSTLRQDLRAIVRLAAPVVLTQLFTMSLGIVDTMMVSRLGTEPLAASALGAVWTWGTLIPLLGVLFGLDPIIAQAHGARDRVRVGLGLQRGLVMAALLSLPLTLLWLNTEAALRLAGQLPSLAVEAHVYVQAQLFSVFPFLAFSALRQWLQGRGIMRPAMWVMAVANLANVLFNWALIFGHLGLPRLGLLGAGIATGLSRCFMAAGLVGLVFWARLERGGWAGWSREALAPAGLLEVCRYGLPAGAQMLFEVWGFHVLTFMAGRLGPAPLAAHMIVLTLASFTFMVPFGISMAAATRVGNLTGARDARGARRAGWLSVGLGAGTMAVMGLFLFVFRRGLPRLWEPEPEVHAAAAAILPIAAAFQVFDGVQVVGTGVLRGIGDTRYPAAFNFVGYYLLAIPFAWWIALERGAGLVGLWWSLTLALATVGALVVARIRRRL